MTDLDTLIEKKIAEFDEFPTGKALEAEKDQHLVLASIDEIRNLYRKALREVAEEAQKPENYEFKIPHTEVEYTTSFHCPRHCDACTENTCICPLSPKETKE